MLLPGRDARADRLLQHHQRVGQVQVVGHGVTEPPVELLGRRRGLLRSLTVLPGRHQPPETAQALVRPLQCLPREVHLAAVARTQAQQAVGERVDTLVRQVGDPVDVPGRLRHLHPAHLQEPAVDPDGDHLVTDGALGLGDLVLVMGELVVIAARMDVEALAQVLHGHGRAFDVPAGESLTPR